VSRGSCCHISGLRERVQPLQLLSLFYTCAVVLAPRTCSETCIIYEKAEKGDNSEIEALQIRKREPQDRHGFCCTYSSFILQQSDLWHIREHAEVW